ncbi:hypothetical protein ABNQ38_07685 (plasmid) [Azospirillum sp. A29]|uniref:hypothetical protein n=1 Tax=Azospirillum sp. A29 TaxID=3160606 RepID=UPI0036705CFB
MRMRAPPAEELYSRALEYLDGLRERKERLPLRQLGVNIAEVARAIGCSPKALRANKDYADVRGLLANAIPEFWKTQLTPACGPSRAEILATSYVERLRREGKRLPQARGTVNMSQVGAALGFAPTGFLQPEPSYIRARQIILDAVPELGLEETPGERRLERYFGHLRARGLGVPGRAGRISFSAIAEESGLCRSEMQRCPQFKATALEAAKELGFRTSNSRRRDRRDFLAPLPAFGNAAEDHPGQSEDNGSGCQMPCFGSDGHVWMDTAAASRYLNIFSDQVRSAANLGAFPAIRKSGPHLEVYVPDLSQVADAAPDTPPIMRLYMLAHTRRFPLPPSVHDVNEKWFHSYMRQRGLLGLRLYHTIPDTVVDLACDYIREMQGHLPTPPRLRKLIGPRRYEHCPEDSFYREHIKRWSEARGIQIPPYFPLNGDVDFNTMKSVLPAELLCLPFTCFDPDCGREYEPIPRSTLIRLLKTENADWRNAIFMHCAIARTHVSERALASALNVLPLLRAVAQERADLEIGHAAAEDLVKDVWEGRICQHFSDRMRFEFVRSWRRVANAHASYLRKLNPEQQALYARYTFAPLSDADYWKRQKISKGIQAGERRRRKAKIEPLVNQLPRLRHIADLRFNQVARLRSACLQAIAQTSEPGSHRCPFSFSYVEAIPTRSGQEGHGRQRIHLRLWDISSIIDDLQARGWTPSPHFNRQYYDAEPHSLGKGYYVEYVATEAEPPGGRELPFWFLDLYRLGIFAGDNTSRFDNKDRVRMLASQGYGKPPNLPAGFLTHRHNKFTRILIMRAANDPRLFLPVEEIYAGCLFGQAMFRLQSNTGARVGEVTQAKAIPGTDERPDGLYIGKFPLNNGKSEECYAFYARPKGKQDKPPVPFLSTVDPWRTLPPSPTTCAT